MAAQPIDTRALDGLQAVAETLREEDFPIDKEGLCYSVGDLGVADASGHGFPVWLLLDRIDQTRFDTIEDVLRLLRVAFAAEVDRREADLG